MEYLKIYHDNVRKPKKVYRLTEDQLKAEIGIG